MEVALLLGLKLMIYLEQLNFGRECLVDIVTAFRVWTPEGNEAVTFISAAMSNCGVILRLNIMAEQTPASRAIELGGAVCSIEMEVSDILHVLLQPVVEIVLLLKIDGLVLVNLHCFVVLGDIDVKAANSRLVSVWLIAGILLHGNQRCYSFGGSIVILDLHLLIMSL